MREVSDRAIAQRVIPIHGEQADWIDVFSFWFTLVRTLKERGGAASPGAM